jgi:hypothetical protein
MAELHSRYRQGEILSSRLEVSILLGTVSTSSRRTQIYPVETQTFLLGRLSSTLVETIISQPEDSITSASKKFSTSGQRMQLFCPNFQLPTAELRST